MVCGGLTSRFEVASYLLELLGKKEEVNIEEVESSLEKNILL